MIQPGSAEPEPRILAAFGVTGPVERLEGGSRPVFRVDDLVLKRLGPRALEHDRSWDLVPWLFENLAALPQVGFRLARPIQAGGGAWMTEDGWVASTYLEGQHATAADVPACIEAVAALHEALGAVPKHPLLDCNASIFGRADRACWGERPSEVSAIVAPLLDALYAVRRPLDGLGSQLIHGDLNPENILVAPGLPPAFLDLAPFWRPPSFALAMFANWIGPRLGDRAVLRHFVAVPHFDQLLVRAAIRMLLIVTENLDQFETSSEERAARLVLEHVRYA